MSGDDYLLIYDGDCGFCRYCVAHARKMCGPLVCFTSLQELPQDFLRDHPYDYEGAIQLFRGDSQIASGAGAAFTLRSLAGSSHWRRWYHRYAWFANASEAIYRWVARHRRFCYRVAKRLWPEPGAR